MRIDVGTDKATALLDQLRSHLQRNLFREAPARSQMTVRRALLYGFLVVLAVAVQLLRAWDLDPLDRLFAEDAFVWLAHAQGGDPLSPLATPYNGYLQTSSRLVAELVVELPPELWPEAMAISGALVVTACAFAVWGIGAAHIRDPYLRAALAAMVILVGVAGPEMLGNVVNTIWFISFACLWLLIWRPRSDLVAASAGCLLLLGATSHAATLFLAPVWLLRLLAARDRRDLLVISGFALGMVLQIWFSYDQLGLAGNRGQAPSPGVAAGQPFSNAPNWDWELIPAYAQRVIGGALGGYRVDSWLWEALGWPFAVLLGAGLLSLVVWAVGTERTRVLVPLLVGLSLSLFLGSGFVRWGAGGSSLYWPPGTSTEIGARYVVLPVLLLLAATFIQLDVASSRRTSGPFNSRMICRAAVLLLLAAALVSFKLEPIFADKTRWSTELPKAEATCRSTNAVTVDVLTAATPYGQYVLPIECKRLR